LLCWGDDPGHRVDLGLGVHERSERVGIPAVKGAIAPLCKLDAPPVIHQVPSAVTSLERQDTGKLGRFLLR
jgi:hypothetical protein